MLKLSEALGLALVCLPACYLFSGIRDVHIRETLAWAGVCSGGAFLATLWLVPLFAPYLARRGLKGRDMGRRGTPLEAVEIPSALGLVCGVAYLVLVISTQLVATKNNPELLGLYSAALLSICFMTLLGFADDVLDLPWRYKLLLPSIASLPLLATYTGGTSIVLPRALGALLAHSDKSGLTPLGVALESTLRMVTIDTAAGGTVVELGTLYLCYMGMLAVFATNAINIYAGINGLEAGQALIIGVAVLTANLYELYSGAGVASPHLFSALLGLPFLAVTAGMLYHNAFPASVFAGDTFCYFAGMTFAVQGILGHFSKTLLLFFIPQVINFVYSTPQLFKVYPCPRHRLPDYDAATDTLRPSTFEVPAKRAGAGGAGVVVAAPAAAAAASAVGRPRKRRGSSSADSAAAGRGAAAAAVSPQSAAGRAAPRRMDNFTLINLVLRWAGPMSERATTNVLLALQVASCALGLWVRYSLGPLAYKA